jgi:hypothetical protein
MHYYIGYWGFAAHEHGHKYFKIVCITLPSEVMWGLGETTGLLE